MGDQRSELDETEIPGVKESATEGIPGLFSGFPKKILPDYVPGYHGPPMDAMLKREDLVLVALQKIWETVQKEKPRRTTRRTTAEEIGRPIEVLFPPEKFPTHTEGIYGVALDTIQGRQELMAYAVQKIFEAVIPDVQGLRTRGKKRGSDEEARAENVDGKRQKTGDTEEESEALFERIPENIFESLKDISKAFAETGQQMLTDNSPKVSAWAITWRQFVMQKLPGDERDKLCKLMEKQWQDLYLKCSKELPKPKEAAPPSTAENITQQGDRGLSRVKKGMARRIIKENKSQPSEESPRVADQMKEVERLNTGDGNNQPTAQVSDQQKKEMTRRNTGDGRDKPIDIAPDQTKKEMARRNTGDGKGLSLERGLDWRKKEAEAQRNQNSGEGKSQSNDPDLDRKKRDAEARKKMGIQ